VGYLEGISFLILLVIAMPLKYLADIPEAVAVVGMLHGILFVLFIVSIMVMTVLHRWTFLWVSGAVLSSIIPFGPFIFDKMLRKHMT
jgi:integral membrane protein